MELAIHEHGPKRLEVPSTEILRFTWVGAFGVPVRYIGEWDDGLGGNRTIATQIFNPCFLVFSYVESTRRSEDSQTFGRVNKVRDKLGWGGGLASPMGGRPKGMHWKTHARLMQELVDASVAAAGAGRVVMDWQMDRLGKIRIPI